MAHTNIVYVLFWLTQLLCHAVLIVATECPECCTGPSVSSDTINVNFMVEETADISQPWNVKALVQWEPPTDNDTFQYSVQFTPNISPDNLSNMMGLNELWLFRTQDCGGEFQFECPTGILFETVTNQPSATFERLLFGYEYKILIQTVRNDISSADILCENKQNIEVSKQFRPLIASPDCLETTGNETYCENQISALVSSIPRDLNVQYTEGFTCVNVTWKRPFSVNGAILAYGINVDPLGEGLARLNIKPTIGPDVFFHKFEASRFELGSSYIISVFARVRLPNEYESMYDLTGIPATFKFRATPPIETTTREQLPTTTERAAKNTRTMNVNNNASNIPVTEIILIGIPTVLLALILIGVLILVYRYSGRRQPASIPEHGEYTARGPARALPEFRHHEILHLSDVIFEETIGRGQFGEVFKAKWNKRDQTRITVAVKTTKENLSPPLKEEFLNEVRVMIDIGKHANILDILACRTVAEPYYIITEYMRYGSLKEYLTKSQDANSVLKDPNYELTYFQQLQISHQISKGMEYLASENFIHGDLAARNILVGEKLTVKISDFGLASDIYTTGYVRLPEESKRPVKWYSLEANLEGKCTIEGDVWSFGIVMYEIYSKGEEPYLGMLPREILTRLKAGYRLDQPEDCPDDIYYLMVDCWLHEPSDRPSFAVIRKTLEGLLTRAQRDSYFVPTREDEE